MAGSLGVHAEEILREKHILISVAVKVGEDTVLHPLGLEPAPPREPVGNAAAHHQDGNAGQANIGDLEFA